MGVSGCGFCALLEHGRGGVSGMTGKRDDGRIVSVKRTRKQPANGKPVTNCVSEVPVVATGITLAYIPLPDESLIDHIRRLTIIQERLLSSCNGARTQHIEDYKFNQRRRSYNPRNTKKRALDFTLPGSIQRGESRAPSEVSNA